MKVPGCAAARNDDIIADDMDFCYDPDDAVMFDDDENDCTADESCEVCQAGCSEDDDCLGSLQCLHRHDGMPVVPGCTFESGHEDKNFCYMPTENSTLSVPDLGAARIDTECTTQEKCQECRGDCDSDDECAGDLKCFIRHKGEHVPGCEEVGFVDPKNDFCYNATAPAAYLSAEGSCSTYECKACQGPCTVDSDCEGSLTCQIRTGYEPVEGCYSGYGIGPSVGSGMNVCAPFPAAREVIYKGSDHCTTSAKCPPCTGDCDTDDECDGPNNKCWQRSRSNSDAPPGCNLNVPLSVDTDICYNDTTTSG